MENQEYYDNPGGFYNDAEVGMTTASKFPPIVAESMSSRAMQKIENRVELDTVTHSLYTIALLCTALMGGQG